MAFPLKTANGAGWLRATCPAPFAKLRDVNATVAALGVEDPRLRLLQERAEGALSQTSFLPQLPQKRRQTAIRLAVLCLRSHSKLIVPGNNLDRCCLSSHNEGKVPHTPAGGRA